MDKVSVAIELATPETDLEVATDARKTSVRALQIAARQRRSADPDLEARARATRRAGIKWHDGGTRFMLVASGGAEAGMGIEAMFERELAKMPTSDSDGPLTTAQRRFDVLTALASQTIASDADQDRATVVIHTDIETIRTGVGGSWTEKGALLSAETMSKLLCDARIKALVEDETGKPLGVGRTMRTAPGWMRVALRCRDRTCRFPGCDRTDFLVPHHVREWTKDRGPTDPDNLPLLCPVHHALVHKDGWYIQGSAEGELVFIGPNGPVRDGPPPLDYDVRKWLWEDLYRPRPEEVLGRKPKKRVKKPKSKADGENNDGAPTKRKRRTKPG